MNVKGLSQNKIKQIRSLNQKKYRNELQLFVVEGEKMVLEVLNNVPELVEYCVCTADFKAISSYNVSYYECDEAQLRSISTLTTPNKVLAVIKKLTFPTHSSDFLLALDGVQDPGNMGTIMRLADWYGVKKIICSTNTVDVYNPKVIQASMGAFLRVEVEYVDLMSYLQSSNLPIYGALLEGVNVYQTTLKNRGILVMGNEGNGISDPIKALVNNAISIPRIGGAESLNVSVATGILLSEFFRSTFH